MGLLTIQEPSDLPFQDKSSIGIDLGTTYSLVSVWKDDKAIVIPDASGQVLLPSVVAFHDHQVLVGQEALRKGVSADTLFSSFKRAMSEHSEEIISDKPHPIVLSAHILTALKQRAEAYLGHAVKKAVITVPAYFDEVARQATKMAAERAGLEVLRLLNEPTAAALMYGQSNLDAGIYAVYDLGGGTFDISIVSLEKGVYRVLSTAGDTALGGDDIDWALVTWFIEHAGIPSLTEIERLHLKSLAKQAKEGLTASPQVTIDTMINQVPLHLTVTRETLDMLMAPWIDKTLMVCHQALQDAGITQEVLTDVILVGGSTRSPYIQKSVAQFFQKTPCQSLDPDQVVAMGAARQAYVLAGNAFSGDLLLDVLPLSIGLEMMGGISEKIITRNMPLPTQITQRYTTYADNQTGMQFHVVQGERELAKDCRSLARFELTQLTPRAAGQLTVEVIFRMDADGLLSVSARELPEGRVVSVEVNARYGLSAERVDTMIEDAITHAEEDVLSKKMAEKSMIAKQLLHTLSDAWVEAHPTLIAAREVLQQALDTNLMTLVAAIKQAEQVAEPFLKARFEERLAALLKESHHA